MWHNRRCWIFINTVSSAFVVGFVSLVCVSLNGTSSVSPCKATLSSVWCVLVKGSRCVLLFGHSRHGFPHLGVVLEIVMHFERL